MQLYKIADQYEIILNQAINEETGEINEMALQKLDQVKSDVKEKGIAVASYIKNREAEISAINEAIRSMQIREKRIKSELEFMENYLHSNMERCGISEISSPYFVVKIKKCPLSVSINDETIIPENYIKSKTMTSIDKVGIKEAIQGGLQVPGAELKQNTRVEIK